MCKYGSHLTPGLTEVRSHAPLFASFLAARIAGRLPRDFGFEHLVKCPLVHAAAAVEAVAVVGLKMYVEIPSVVSSMVSCQVVHP